MTRPRARTGAGHAGVPDRRVVAARRPGRVRSRGHGRAARTGPRRSRSPSSPAATRPSRPPRPRPRPAAVDGVDDGAGVRGRDGSVGLRRGDTREDRTERFAGQPDPRTGCVRGDDAGLGFLDPDAEHFAQQRRHGRGTEPLAESARACLGNQRMINRRQPITRDLETTPQLRGSHRRTRSPEQGLQLVHDRLDPSEHDGGPLLHQGFAHTYDFSGSHRQFRELEPSNCGKLWRS